MTKRLFLIDAMAMAFRNFYAFGMKQLTNSAGQPTSAVFGSAQFMMKLIGEERPDYLAICQDSDEKKTFRHEMFPAYKANRSAMPEELAVQMGDFNRLIRSFGCPVLRVPGVEADDLIGTIATQFAQDDLEVFIVSGDKDFMQLVGERLKLVQPKKGDEAAIIGEAGVREKFGVSPRQVIDCLAIIGDASDNVPGVHGIGDKGAAKLVSEYGSLEGIYENIDRIANKRQREALLQDRDQAFLSRQLVTIKTDVPLDGLTLEDMACDPESAVANEQLLSLFKQMEFKALIAKVEAAMTRGRAKPATKAALTRPPAPAAAVQLELGLEVEPEPEPEPESQAVVAVQAAAPRAFDNYHLVDGEAALQRLLTRLSAATAFAFDSETTGLDIVASEPIGFSFAFEAGEAFYLPVVTKHLQGLTPGDVLSRLKAALERSTAVKIGHNLKFDLQMLENVGITMPGPYRDTMIMDWLLDATGRQHGLDACCLRYLSYEKIKTSTLIGDKGQIPMLEADLVELTRYACEDADFTLRLDACLLPRIDESDLRKVLETVEMPLVPVLARMERRGIYIDVDVLLNFSMRLAAMAEELEARIYEEAGTQFNINSTKQLADILFNQLKVHEAVGLRSLKKTKSGYSTDESVLEKLKAHPLPRAILEYRSVSKLKSTYVDALPQLVHPKTHRLHTSFHQTGTATGRLSSSNPNLQNIPIRTELGQEIRKAFTAQGEDCVIISADYSQIELRLLAHMADEKALQEAFAKGQDIHRLTASKVFGVPMDQVDQTMRSRAKAINFGIIYGMGPRRLAATTGVSMQEASDFIAKYFAGYPEIDAYIEQAVAFARQKGESRTLTGRRRPISGMQTERSRDAASAENIAVNSPIQGSAADLIKIAMIRIDGELGRRGMKTRMLLQVHDELVFEAPRSELEAATRLIEDGMRHAMDLKVPLDVQIGHGTNWLEAH
jgi:DNA polymerase-1